MGVFGHNSRFKRGRVVLKVPIIGLFADWIQTPRDVIQFVKPFIIKYTFFLVVFQFSVYARIVLEEFQKLMVLLFCLHSQFMINAFV